MAQAVVVAQEKVDHCRLVETNLLEQRAPSTSPSQGLFVTSYRRICAIGR